MYQGVRCRERIPLKPTSANLKRAEQHRAAILDAIHRGIFDYATTFPNSTKAASFARRPGDVETVEAYLERWLKRKAAELKASTLLGYSKIVHRLLIPKFGEWKLSALKRRDVREWLETIDDDKKAKLSNKRLANIQSVLSSALSDAADDELIDVNPLTGWRYQRKEAPKPDDDIDPFDPKEQAAIYAACRDEGDRNMFTTFMWTGLRTSELIALDWDRDIDLVREEIRITQANTRAAKGQAEDTKTIAGRRVIKMLPPVKVALLSQKAITLLRGQAVFINAGTGKRWTGDNQIWKIWQTIIKKAKVRYRNPYQTRHTFASMMLSAGEHPMWVAKQMGHKDWTMIARIYGKWMPSADPDAGSKAVAKFATCVPAEQELMHMECLQDQS